jgi:hypothetical protein
MLKFAKGNARMNFLNDPHPAEWLKIRNEKNKYRFNFKIGQARTLKQTDVLFKGFIHKKRRQHCFMHYWQPQQRHFQNITSHIAHLRPISIRDKKE